MGLFSELTGSASAKRAKKAGKQAQAAMDSAYAEARPLLTAGYDEAEGIVDTGYGNASDWLQNGYNDAFAQLGAGYGRAEDQLRDAYATADNRLTGGRDLAREVLDPFYQSGRGAQDMYDTALGLNGTTAQGQFYDDYADHDPFRDFSEEMANKSLAAYYNARGLNTSGRGAIALSRASLERGTEDLNNYLDRLERQGVRGGEYANQIAGLEERTGNNRAQLSSRLGEILGGNEVDRGVRESNLTYGHGKDQANLETGRTTAQANLRTARGSDEANLVYGHGQQKAGNIIGTTNAVNQSRQSGVQNILSGAATLAGAFIPGASGVSLAGNVGNRLLGGFNRATGNAYGDAGTGTWNPAVLLG